MTILHSERLRLRCVDPGDAPFYLALLNDPAWIRNIGDRGVHTLEQARKAIADGPVAMYAKLGFSLYLVERAADRLPLGLCGLIKRDALAEVDIGYAFLPEHRGQGYAIEAARTVLAHARDTLGMRRLMAITSPDNVSSNQLLGKLGFRFDMLTVLAGEQRQSNLYSIDLAERAAC